MKKTAMISLILMLGLQNNVHGMQRQYFAPGIYSESCKSPKYCRAALLNLKTFPFPSLKSQEQMRQFFTIFIMYNNDDDYRRYLKYEVLELGVYNSMSNSLKQEWKQKWRKNAAASQQQALPQSEDLEQMAELKAAQECQKKRARNEKDKQALLLKIKRKQTINSKSEQEFPLLMKSSVAQHQCQGKMCCDPEDLLGSLTETFAQEPASGTYPVVCPKLKKPAPRLSGYMQALLGNRSLD